jgi:hypothetical protein
MHGVQAQVALHQIAPQGDLKPPVEMWHWPVPAMDLRQWLLREVVFALVCPFVLHWSAATIGLHP